MSDLERLHFYVTDPEAFLDVTSKLWAKSVGEIADLTTREVNALAHITYHTRVAEWHERLGNVKKANLHSEIAKDLESDGRCLSAREKILSVQSFYEEIEEE